MPMMDPSIYQNLGKPTVALQDPMQSMGQALQMQGMMQQQQTAGLQHQQLQQQIQDANDLRETLKSANGYDDAIAKAQKLGSSAAQSFLKNAVEMKLKGVELDDKSYKLANERLSKAGASILSAAHAPSITPGALASMIIAHVKTGELPQGKAQEMIASLPSDPSAIPTWGKLQAINLGTAPEALKLFMPKVDIKDMGGNIQSFNENPLTGEVKPGSVLGAKTVTPDAVLSAETARRGQNMTDARAKQALLQNQLSPEALDMEITKFITKGELDSDLGRNLGARSAVLNGAAQRLADQGLKIDLATNKIKFATAKDAMKYYTTGQGGTNIQKQEVIIHHAQAAQDLFDALKNGNIPLANKAANTLGIQLQGNDLATNVNLAGHILSQEVGTYLANGQGTGEEREALSKFLGSDKSPQQFKGAVGTLQTFVRAQNNAAKIRRDAALKGEIPEYPGERPALPKSSESSTATKTYKPGDIETARDGTRMVFNGGDPMQKSNWKKVN